LLRLLPHLLSTFNTSLSTARVAERNMKVNDQVSSHIINLILSLMTTFMKIVCHIEVLQIFSKNIFLVLLILSYKLLNI
jgi:hypothetical protein